MIINALPAIITKMSMREAPELFSSSLAPGDTEVVGRELAVVAESTVVVVVSIVVTVVVVVVVAEYWQILSCLPRQLSIRSSVPSGQTEQLAQ
jgi:nucleoside recognition membrane protein YjiH